MSDSIIDGVLAGAQAALGITPEQHLRWCLNRISDLESDLHAARAVLADARAASARDLEARREAIVLADRLAAGLREALEFWEAHLTWLEKRLVGGPDGGTRWERSKIAELRKLVF